MCMPQAKAKTWTAVLRSCDTSYQLLQTCDEQRPKLRASQLRHDELHGWLSCYNVPTTSRVTSWCINALDSQNAPWTALLRPGSTPNSGVGCRCGRTEEDWRRWRIGGVEDTDKVQNTINIYSFIGRIPTRHLKRHRHRVWPTVWETGSRYQMIPCVEVDS